MNAKAQAWIWDAGPRKVRAALPKELAVTDGAVYSWLYGRANPSYERAKALVKMAKADTVHGGKKACLTVDDFLSPHEYLSRTTTTTEETSNA